MDKSKNTSEKSNRDPTKVEPVYTRDFPHWIMEVLKGGVVKNTNDGK